MRKSELVRISSKGQFVIPKAIRDALGIEEGGELLVMLDGETIILTRPESLARVTRGMLKGTWARTRQGVGRAIRDERESWD